MTSAELIKALKEYPENAEIIVEIAKDDKLYAAEPTAIWVRSAGKSLSLIISNDD